MTAIQLLSCAGLIVGAFLLLHLKPVEFTDSLFAFLLRPKKGIRRFLQFHRKMDLHGQDCRHDHPGHPGRQQHVRLRSWPEDQKCLRSHRVLRYDPGSHRDKAHVDPRADEGS